MGNHHATGHAFNFCGCTDVFGFEGSAKAVIHMYDIQPWNARSLIRDRLNKQGDLARTSPLRKVPVKDGLSYFRQKVTSSWVRPSSEVQKDEFVETIIMLLGRDHVNGNEKVYMKSLTPWILMGMGPCQPANGQLAFLST
eukprot:symbB.v1.2.011405.t1/scaffold764.1/size165801/11